MQPRQLLWTMRSRQTPTSAPDPPSAALVARRLRDTEELLDRERRLREELERANGAKDRFIAILAHDLRSPIHAILGWTQLMRREALDVGGRSRALARIERSALLQSNLIEELLDISRMSADCLQLSLSLIEVGPLVERLVEAAVPRAAELDLEIVCSVEVGLLVLGDRPRLEQIVSNLVSNALQSTPPSGRIVVEANQEARCVRICVRDTGPGVAVELIGRAFEMPAQGDHEASVPSGLGIGLYIVKRLVELHEGEVEVASDGEGKGAQFVVRLPRHGAEAAPPSEPIPEAASLANRRILVVDDDQDSRDLLATALVSSGATVVRARNGNEAVRLALHWPAHVVVSDVDMPGSDGCAMLTAIRQHAATVAAIAVSGFTCPRFVERVLAGGFDRFVAKPLEIKMLVQTICGVAEERARFDTESGVTS